MGVPTKADVLLVAPELSVITDDAVWALYLAATAERVDAGRWGGDSAAVYRLAFALLCAHALTLRSDSGATDPVQSETVGGVSRTYLVALAPSFGKLDATTYGEQFQSLSRNNGCIRGPWVI